MNQPIVDENSNAAFDIVYADAQGEKKAVSGLQVRLIRERRDYYWNWSEGEGWQSQFDQKDLVEGEQTLDLKASGPVIAGRITATAVGLCVPIA